MAKKPFIKQTVMTWMFQGLELPKLAETVREVGLDGVDLGIGGPALENTLNSDVKGIFANEGLKVYSTSLGMSPAVDFSSPDAEVRKAATAYAKRGIDATKHVGADRVLISPTPLFMGNVKYNVDRKTDWAQAAESMREAAEYAKANGIYLMLEPVNHFMMALINTVGEGVQLAKDIGVDGVTVAADIFHMNFEEDTGCVRPLYQAGADMIKELHLGDNSRRAPGHGSLDWRPIIGALYDIGFDGPMVHEPAYTQYPLAGLRDNAEAYEYFLNELRFGAKFINMIQESLQ